MAKTAKKIGNLTTMCEQYDALRKEETRITNEKEQIGIQIKATFGDKLDIPNPVFKLAYHYDDDKTTYTVDWTTMKKDDPKAYKKWVHEATIPGNRRLQVTRIEKGTIV